MAIDGTYLQGITTVVHDWTQVDFANFIYSAVKFGVTDGNSVIINGTSMVKVAGVTVDILVDYNTTELGDTGDDVYFLGNPRPTLTDSITGGVDEYLTKYSMLIKGPVNSQQINCGNDSSQMFGGDVTISCWGFPLDTEPPPGPGTGEDGYLIERYASSKGWGIRQDRIPAAPEVTTWTFRIGDDISFRDLIDTTLIGKGRWYHIVGVLEGFEMRLYVDGVKVAVMTLPGPNVMVPAAASNDIRIGSQSNNAGEFYGNLNNASVWTSALTDEEVLEVFNGGRPMDLNLHAPQRASLLSWWKVGDDAQWDGTNYTIPDQVGPNNGITTTGASPWVWGQRQINAPQLNIDA